MLHERDSCFEFAAGSVVGRTHARSGKANQDAFASGARGGRLVAVVADGCGSGAHSEVGAQIGARVVVEQALRWLEAGDAPDSPALWGRVLDGALSALGTAARAMGGRLQDTVTDLLLFTVLGVAVDEQRAAVFGIGDGVFAVERAPAPGRDRGAEERVLLGPFPGNAPPYLAYGLLGGGPRFSIHRAFAAADLGAVLLGTDGAAELDALADRPIPGSPEGEPGGPLSRLWRDDRYFKNRDALRRRLSMMSRESSRRLWDERRVDRRPGLLEDDTTVVVVRRRREAGA